MSYLRIRCCFMAAFRSHFEYMFAYTCQPYRCIMDLSVGVGIYVHLWIWNRVIVNAINTAVCEYCCHKHGTVYTLLQLVKRCCHLKGSSKMPCTRHRDNLNTYAPYKRRVWLEGQSQYGVSVSLDGLPLGSQITPTLLRELFRSRGLAVVISYESR